MQTAHRGCFGVQVNFTTESAEVYGKSRRSIPTETKPSKPQNECGRLYALFAARSQWRSRRARLSWRKALNRPRVRFERAWRNRVGLVAAHRLSSRTLRNTPSTPSAADSEFSPAVIERASGSHVKRRGRKFAESDAFFGGFGLRADKFCLLPFSSVVSVVKTAGTGHHRPVAA